MSGFNYTNAETVSFNQTQFYIISASALVGLIIISVLMTWMCTSCQYKYSPPTEWERRNELYQEAWNNAHGVKKNTVPRTKANKPDDSLSDIEMTNTRSKSNTRPKTGAQP